jgi:hypothetical protein
MSTLSLDLIAYSLERLGLHMARPDKARQNRRTEFGPPSQYIQPRNFGQNASSILNSLTALVHDAYGGGVDGLSPSEDQNISQELK